MYSPKRLWLLALALATAAGAATAADPIPEANFDKLHALIKPDSAAEKWAQIPWLADLWEARRKAAAEGKPILLWEMDGHPLGCT